MNIRLHCVVGLLGATALTPGIAPAYELLKESGACPNGIPIAERPELLDFVDELVVSLDSPDPWTNDAQRGAGAHAGATAAIEEGLRRGLRTVVNATLTRNNLPDLEALLAFCEDRGVLMNAQPAVFGRRYYDNAARAIGLGADEIGGVHRALSAVLPERAAVLDGVPEELVPELLHEGLDRHRRGVAASTPW